MRKTERKVVPFLPITVKAKADGPVTFSGYASTFGNTDLGGDIVMPGAFKESLGGRDPKMFWNHNARMIPVGKWVDVKEDDKGLLVKGELTPGHSVAEDLAAAIRHGTVDKMSIGYRTIKSEYDEDSETRKLTQVELMEISPVNFPMNEQADITAVKSMIDGLATLKEVEQLLRDAAGFSVSEAKALVSRFKMIVREADIASKSQREDATARLVALIESLD